MRNFILSFLAVCACAAVPAHAEKIIYKIDAVHSGIEFKVRHFINKVPGNFGEFEGEIHFDKENPEKSKAVASIKVASVDTRNKDRDSHLLNEDFFNTSKFPMMTFSSTKWEEVGENLFHVTGDLTFNGVTKPITMEVSYLGEVEGRGAMRSGWEGKATIDRTEWNMGYGYPGPVGKDVDIELNIQAHRS